jgi:hypothetical protein
VFENEGLATLVRRDEMESKDEVRGPAGKPLGTCARERCRNEVDKNALRSCQINLVQILRHARWFERNGMRASVIHMSRITASGPVESRPLTRRLVHHFQISKLFQLLYENGTVAFIIPDRNNLCVTASSSQLDIVSVESGDGRKLLTRISAWNSSEELKKDDCTLRPLRVRMGFTISSGLLPFWSG